MFGRWFAPGASSTDDDPEAAEPEGVLEGGSDPLLRIGLRHSGLRAGLPAQRARLSVFASLSLAGMVLVAPPLAAQAAPTVTMDLPSPTGPVVPRGSAEHPDTTVAIAGPGTVGSLLARATAAGSCNAFAGATRSAASTSLGYRSRRAARARPGMGPQQVPARTSPPIRVRLPTRGISASSS